MRGNSRAQAFSKPDAFQYRKIQAERATSFDLLQRILISRAIKIGIGERSTIPGAEQGDNGAAATSVDSGQTAHYAESDPKKPKAVFNSWRC